MSRCLNKCKNTDAVYFYKRNVNKWKKRKREKERENALKQTKTVHEDDLAFVSILKCF